MFTRLVFAAVAASPVALAQISTFTRYGGGCTTNQGACGDPIGHGYTAALSQAQFGDNYKGPACGTCYELTINDNLYGEHPHRTITITVDNECPAKGNEEWCSIPNKHGGQIHFDLCDASGAADALLGPGGGTGKGFAKKVDCKTGAQQGGGSPVGGGSGGGNSTGGAAPATSGTPVPVAGTGSTGKKCKRSKRAANKELKPRQPKPWNKEEMLGA